MKNIIVLLLAIYCHSVCAQSTTQIDSLVTTICQSINEEKNEITEEKMYDLFLKHIEPFLINETVKNPDSIIDKIDLRLQRNCEMYHMFIRKKTGNEESFMKLEKPLVSTVSKKEYRGFFKIKKFKYLESNGDMVNVYIDKKFWIDYFKDGTFSKLSLEKISLGKFEIEFITSNNEARKGFSNVGDKYVYTIVEKKENYYKMMVEIPGRDTFFAFRLYYDTDIIPTKL